MRAHSLIHATEPSASDFLPTDRFEVGQYVRVFLANGRTEIGQVSAFEGDKVVVTTQHGYDRMVSPRAIKRAFLLVLDLNGVLGARGKGTFVHRPYVEEFLKFVFSNFAVAVWTSGLERSSNPIIESVFRGYQDRLLFTFYRDSCTPRPTKDNPWGTVKDLQRIFSQFPKSFHSVNTIIVDDSPSKCSHPDIALCPVPFNDSQAQKDDDGLHKAILVLQEVLMVESHAPIIRAAEERMEAIRAGKHGVAEAAKLHHLERDTAPPAPSPPDVLDEERDARPTEVDLWKSRLCCDFLRGHCDYGDECRYSHDADDDRRPCSRKSKCPYGHAVRWIHTEGDEILSKKRKANARFHDASENYFLSKHELKKVQGRGRMHTGVPSEDATLEQEAVAREAKALRGRGGRGERGEGRTADNGMQDNRCPPQPSVPLQLLFSTDPSRNRASTSSNSSGAVEMRQWGGGRQEPSAFGADQAAQPPRQQQQLLAQLQQFQREKQERRAHAAVPAPRGTHELFSFPSGTPCAGENWGQRPNREGDSSAGGWQVGAQPQPQTQYQVQGSQQGSSGGPQPLGNAIHLVGSASDQSSLVRQLQALELQQGRR